ncbi:PASTA domain-containing protein [Gorillibacterium sp. sgz5001074]|uniref:PASTA domain-containing protein n=1 Tax=Gorillibacterium sp. sgz5001074 TaxID=3446695 RepID=UPI003F66F507
MELFDNRYRLEQAWRRTDGGWLALAHDHKLNRSVILWRQADTDTHPKEEILRRLGQASRHGDRRYVPVLDVSVGGNGLYAVLVRDQGRFLTEALPMLHWTGQEILEQLLELCPAIREARRERLQDFAVTAGNLWLDRDGRLRLINIWSEGSSDHRDVKGLSTLLYQLCSGSEEPPASLSRMYQSVKAAMSGLPGGTAEEAADWAGSALLPSCTLRDYEGGIRRLLETVEPTPAPSSVPTKRSRPFPGEPTEGTLQSHSSPKRQPVRPTASPSDRMGEDTNRGWSMGPWIRFSLIGFGIGLCGIALFWWMIRLPDGEADGGVKANTAASAPAAVSTPVGSTVPAASQQPKGTSHPSPSPSPGSSSSPAKPSTAPAVTESTVPDLTQKTLEEASQLALKAGLRYSYQLEVHETEKGRVFKQDLAPGTPVSKGDRIVFWVSKGKG